MLFDRIKLKVHTRAMLDSAYLLFLEPPSEDVEAQQSLSQRVLDYAIRAFQGHPKLMHVELLLPPSPTEQHLLHFATYFQRRAELECEYVQQGCKLACNGALHAT